ncbi:MAG: hypothetical protein P0119_01915 [Nitrospira sp.]|nr:hypothetical protein [Nitrospira sp.]
MSDWNKGNGAALDLNQHDITVKNRAGSTHPRAEQRPMRGRLMLSVMSRMFGRLRLRQSANRKDTEHKCGGKNLIERLLHRRLLFQAATPILQ